MHDKTQKNEMSPVTAALTGIVIGAAGAAAVALSDEDTRKKATKKALQIKKDLTKWSADTIHDLHNKGQTIKQTTDGKMDEKKKELAEDVTAGMSEAARN